MNNKLFLLVLVFLFAAQNVNAELYNSTKKAPETNHATATNDNKGSNSNTPDRQIPKIDSITLNHIRSMAVLCVGNWENENCSKELSALSMDMTTNYAEKLDKQSKPEKKEAHMESLKQHCAASTAALKVSVPSYAMKSAITECVNIVADINEESSVKPDINLYQLLVGAVLCLNKDLSCENMEKQISSVASNN